VRIEYATRKLEKVLNDAGRLKQEFGSEQAQKIQLRLAVLEAAVNLAEVPAGKPDRCHALKGDRAGEFAVDLKHPFRLIFKPQEPLSKLAGVGIEKTKVNAIIILEVVNYHED
jgi:proteic killer suppression protein